MKMHWFRLQLPTTIMSSLSSTLCKCHIPEDKIYDCRLYTFEKKYENCRLNTSGKNTRAKRGGMCFLFCTGMSEAGSRENK
jgi:hypothetical protein